MFKKTTYTLIAAIFLAGTAIAADLPSYYPADGFQRVGVLDSVQLERQVIIISDIPYSLANSLIVHSTSAYSVPTSQLRIGSKIGYKMARSGRLITEIWLLPNNYESPRRQ